jgi:hypothetical protein
MTKKTNKTHKVLKAIVACDLFNVMDEKTTTTEISIDLKIANSFDTHVTFLTKSSAV